MQRGLRAIRILLYITCFAVILADLPVAEECRAADEQRVVTTQHTTLTFNTVGDMNTFNKEINFAARSSLASIFGSSDSQSVEGELIKKVDLLFEKVQLILDMRKEMKKVRVRVFSNAEQLRVAYEKIFKQKCTVRGWYLFEFDTVFLNVEDVHEGMLAHELGHAIIDHFFAVRPPRATAEILAKYVDAHLNEEAKQYNID